MMTSDTARIREFKKSDTALLQQLIHATIDIAYLPLYPQQAINFFKGFHSCERILERAEKGKTIVLEKNAHLIGTGSFLKW